MSIAFQGDFAAEPQALDGVARTFSRNSRRAMTRRARVLRGSEITELRPAPPRAPHADSGNGGGEEQDSRGRRNRRYVRERQRDDCVVTSERKASLLKVDRYRVSREREITCGD